jgi:hypothetical protein
MSKLSISASVLSRQQYGDDDYKSRETIFEYVAGDDGFFIYGFEELVPIEIAQKHDKFNDFCKSLQKYCVEAARKRVLEKELSTALGFHIAVDSSNWSLDAHY